MRTVIVEIMTVAEDVSALETSSALCEKGLIEPEALLQVEEGLVYHPATGKISVIVLLDSERDVMSACFDDESGFKKIRRHGKVFIPKDEAGSLRYFWKRLRRYDRFVTFNGRGFVCPFLMMRSAAHGISCQRNLMPYRYSHRDHVDLCDQLTFYGAYQKRSLAQWCRMFGLADPGSRDDGYGGLLHFCIRRAFLIRSLFWVWRDNLSF